MQNNLSTRLLSLNHLFEPWLLPKTKQPHQENLKSWFIHLLIHLHNSVFLTSSHAGIIFCKICKLCAVITMQEKSNFSVQNEPAKQMSSPCIFPCGRYNSHNLGWQTGHQTCSRNECTSVHIQRKKNKTKQGNNKPFSALGHTKRQTSIKQLAVSHLNRAISVAVDIAAGVLIIMP